MDSYRRAFLKQSGFIGGGFFVAEPLKQLNNFSEGKLGFNFLREVSIFHTNDLHNNIEPLQTGKQHGYGGLTNIGTVLKHSTVAHVLLDAGDFVDDAASVEQQQMMIGIMNKLGFDAATIGNRELARGTDHLAQLIPMMKFPLLNCNYAFDHPVLKSNVQSFKIIKTGKYKIGITGVGTHQLKTMDGIHWHHPYDKANAIASHLKKEKGCDLVICLSHLGYIQDSGPHNAEFAKVSEHIDLIIGGHGDQLMTGHMILKNKSKQEVIVSHGGPGGILVKQVMFGFDVDRQKNNIACRSFVPGAAAEVSAYKEIRRIMA
jgi:5'-nucleotidase